MKYFICGLPYQVSIKEGLLMRDQIVEEMSEADFNELTWQMEMETLWWGDTDGAFFSYTDVTNRRKLKTPMYAYELTENKAHKVPDLVYNERRILSADVALMASGSGHKNDSSSIFINSAIPTNSDSYVGNFVYSESHEGLNTDELALIIRRLFKIYKCTDLVLDTSGQGLGVYDALIRDIVDPETGELYEALSCCNDDKMAERCKVDGAPKVIWSIKASASFNSEMCIRLRSGFQKGKINLLVSEEQAGSVLKEKNSAFKKMNAEEQARYLNPYIQTTMLVLELINLQHEAKGTTVRITEKSGMRKDRYSSVGYNYYVQCELEREVLQKPQKKFTMSAYAQGFRQLNFKPRQV